MRITIDTLSLTSQFDVSKDQIDQLLDNVSKSLASSFAERLEQEAKKGLHQTRNIYINSIKVLDEGRFKGVVLLDYSKNKLVKMLEEGASPFDLKEGFGKSSKKHLTKDGKGWYLSIPFRESTPGAVGESDVFNGAELPKEVYNLVKDRETNIETKTGFKSKPIIESELSEKYKAPRVRKEVTNIQTNKKFEEYKNKTSIFTGISKIKDNITGQNLYMSFRRVSNNSDENSWIHTGLEKRDFVSVALRSLESNLSQELNRATNQSIIDLGLTLR